MTHPLAPLWERLAGPADKGPVDFAALHAASRPNRYLVAPPGLCPDGDADEEAPAFSVPVDVLREAFRVAAFAEPNAQFVDGGGAQDRYLVRSRLLGFPDRLVAEFRPLGLPGGFAAAADTISATPGMAASRHDASTLAVLSESQLGHSDLGVNKARVRRILGRLKARLPVLTGV